MDPAQPFPPGYRRYGYGQSLPAFLATPAASILGELTQRSAFDVDQAQAAAWEGTIATLRAVLSTWQDEGHLFLEFDVPRLGRRNDEGGTCSLLEGSALPGSALPIAQLGEAAD